MNGDLVGHLSKLKNSALEFQYSDSWIEDYPSFPISRNLPVTEKVYKGEEVSNYFENLLPDSKQVREKLAANLKAGSASEFDLLSIVGKDCIGALQLVPDDWEPPQLEEAKGIELSEQEILETLNSLYNQPLGMGREEDFRISLAGNQEKTALLKINNKWLRPIGSSPTTHIFKPAMGVFANGIDMRDSVENEYLCLAIFKHFGLTTANAEIIKIDDKQIFVVERFDRRRDGKFIYRLPQEDMCQALGYPSTKKYQNDGGPGIEKIMELLKESDNSELDRKDFLKAQLLNWLIAGIDGHAKNYSIFWEPGGFKMTPIYDVLSAASVIKKGKLSSDKIKLAMCVGENRHYKWKKIHLRHWFQTQEKIKYPKKDLEEIIHEILRDSKKLRDSISKKMPKDFSEESFECILTLTEDNIRKLEY